ncbi:glycosyltransferase family 1 protein [Clostridium sp. NSJ-145]|uniref:glycosyltransferase family 1 protein n=1 Tax=Clostridium sp. NSJ-145 TaxID=2897777 RepID=UPI001E2BBCF6|nr:glycosyltransferase family 1 protein [Clostridium sp. NSJ-145]MCD2502906.1 glycosyltransferase family 1 protein [Clostridium sp. NSJ-145]
MSKSRILHVTGAMNVGGTETMLINLYRKVNNQMIFDFISYSDKEAYYDKEIEKLGGKVIRLKAPSERGFLGSINDIRKVIKENGPYTAVHTHMLFNCGIAMISAYFLGVKIRVSHAHTTADNSTSLIRKLYISVMRLLIRIFSTNFLACSDAAGRYLFGDNIINNKKYKILPNYIDYEKFINSNDKNKIRLETGIKEDDIVIGHIGRFITAKNHTFLIDVANEMIQKNSKVKLILVGTGNLEKQIKEKVKKLGIDSNVYFLGVRDDIPSILKSMNLFILPSISEGLGLVLLEAQASQIPCLVSEAIQPEVDLGVNLINKINLSCGKEEWARKAFDIIEKNNNKSINIVNAVKEKKYDLNSILDNLKVVYNLNLS